VFKIFATGMEAQKFWNGAFADRQCREPQRHDGRLLL